MTDFRNNALYVGSRGLRNNNPMNIRPFKVIYKGQIGVDNTGMAIFETVEYGLRAGANELMINYSKHGLNTIAKQINDFAPPSENNTQAYINAVSKSTGIAPNKPLIMDYKTVRALMRAIVDVELGTKYSNVITAKMIENGMNLLSNSMLVKTGVSFAFVGSVALLIYFLTKQSN